MKTLLIAVLAVFVGGSMAVANENVGEVVNSAKTQQIFAKKKKAKKAKKAKKGKHAAAAPAAGADAGAVTPPPAPPAEAQH